MRVVKAVGTVLLAEFLVVVAGLVLSSPLAMADTQTHSTTDWSPICESILDGRSLYAATYIINYGDENESSYGNVTVIKNKTPSNKQEKDRRDRPEMDIPRPEPRLEIITPTPTKREVPVPAIIPEISKINPPKKPKKDLPN